MDFSKLSKGDQIFAGGVLVFFIAMFFDWFSVDAGPISIGANGWDYGFWGVLMFLILLVLLVVLGLARFGNAASIPKLPWPAIFLAGSGFVALMTILKLLIGEDDPFGRSFGIFLAVAGALLAVFGAFMKFKEGGGKVDDLKSVDSLKQQFGRDGGV